MKAIFMAFFLDIYSYISYDIYREICMEVTMAGKIKITQEEILNKAFEITKKEGIMAVNARRLALECSCSIQPIYYYFNTMDELRRQIILKSKEEYNQYIQRSKEQLDEKAFKAVGIAYILFAENEPELFKLLFMNHDENEYGLSTKVDDNFEYILSTVMEQTNLSRENAKKFYEIVWIATHGIATMLATKFMNFREEQVSEYLSLIYKGVLKELNNDHD